MTVWLVGLYVGLYAGLYARLYAGLYAGLYVGLYAGLYAFNKQTNSIQNVLGTFKIKHPFQIL